MTTPTNKKAPAPTKTQNAFITSTDTEDYPTARLSSKAAGLASCLVQAGYVVHDVADGYIVVRADWNMSRYCANLADLQAFARKVGVFHA